MQLLLLEGLFGVLILFIIVYLGVGAKVVRLHFFG